MAGIGKDTEGLGFIMTRKLSILHDWLFLLVALGTILSLEACSSGANPELKIGLIAPLTGEYAETTGQPAVDAAQLAVDEINEAGGLEVAGKQYTIVLLAEDNGGTPETAVAAAQKLINQEGVIAIVGPMFSSNAIPVADVAEKARIPMISPTSTNPQTTLGKQFAFRATFIDNFQGLAMARFTLNELGIQKAAVLYDVASAYNQGLAEAYREAFEAAGGQIVAFESYTTDQNQDFETQLTRIQASDAEALFLPNYTDDVLLQGQQARELGFEDTFLGSDAWEGERLSGQAAFENSFFSGHFCRDESIAKIHEFSTRYEEKYGREPNGLIALSYDSMGLLFAAMQSQGAVKPEAIRDGLYDISYQGLTGTIGYTDIGDPIKSVAIWRIQNGERDCYQMIDP